MRASIARYAVAVFLGMTGFLLVREDAIALSPVDLLASCEAIPDASSLSAEKTFDIAAEGLPCWYYMSAVQNMTVLADERGERLLGICPPPDSTVLDFVRVFVQYARTEDVGSQRNAAAFALLGLARAFPC
jgi:Rap1a immunity proteins